MDIRNCIKVIDDTRHKCILFFKILIFGFKEKEIKISDDFNLWSHRMIESLIRDIDILRERIQKLESDLRSKK